MQKEDHGREGQNSICLQKAIKAVTAIAKKERKNLGKNIEIEIEDNLPYVIVDELYFHKALEEIIKIVMDNSDEKDAIKLLAYEGNQKIYIIILSFIGKRELRKIKSNTFIKHTFELHGINLDTSSADKSAMIEIVIPKYRVNGK